MLKPLLDRDAMIDLNNVRDTLRQEPALMLRLQLLLVLAASLVLPVLGFWISCLREWMRSRMHTRPTR